jgi:hypothetical protein
LHDALNDLMILVWHGETEAEARAAAMNDLGRLERELAEYDRRLPDDGTVRLALACAEIDDAAVGPGRDARLQLRELIGRTLASSDEQPIARFGVIAANANVSPGGS